MQLLGDLRAVICLSLSDIGEINTLITSSMIDGLKLDIVFGGDYKVHVCTCACICMCKLNFVSFYSVSTPCYGMNEA